MSRDAGGTLFQSAARACALAAVLSHPFAAPVAVAGSGVSAGLVPATQTAGQDLDPGATGGCTPALEYEHFDAYWWLCAGAAVLLSLLLVLLFSFNRRLRRGVFSWAGGHLVPLPLGAVLASLAVPALLVWAGEEWGLFSLECAGLGADRHPGHQIAFLGIYVGAYVVWCVVVFWVGRRLRK